MISGESQLFTIHPIYAKDKIKFLYKFWNTNYSLPNHRLKSYDSFSDTFNSGEIIDIINTGKQSVFQVVLENGKSLNCTKDTKFLTEKGFYKLDIDMVVATTQLISCCNRPIYSRIIRIEYIGEEETFKVETNANYIVNGIIIK
jgi:hypothetical protein